MEINLNPGFFLPASEYFRRHKDVQKRHSGSLSPLLEALSQKKKRRNEKKVEPTALGLAGPSLEGEQGERWLPQVFGTYLIGFQKNLLSVDPY